ncbi:MAG: YraN family protein [Clostridia bacterium]
MFNKILGAFGEIKATNYLKKLGYKILKRNYRCPIGEIDIICLDKGVLVFVEVKYRKNLDYGRPSQAVNKHKQGKIIQVAKYYIVEHDIVNTFCRFDCVEIIDKQINHIISAFTR